MHRQFVVEGSGLMLHVMAITLLVLRVSLIQVEDHLEVTLCKESFPEDV